MTSTTITERGRTVNAPTKLLAYHGDLAIKAKYLRRVRAHAKADQLVQGYGYWIRGRGCAVGCTVHVSANPHSRYPIELGIPEELAYLKDKFFENLPDSHRFIWPDRFLSAIRPGADLSRVYDLWTAWNLIDPTDGVITLVTDEFPEIQRIVRETGQACLRGDRPSVAAAGAAWAAAAVAAAWAARAAWAAAPQTRAAAAAALDAAAAWAAAPQTRAAAAAALDAAAAWAAASQTRAAAAAALDAAAAWAADAWEAARYYASDRSAASSAEAWTAYYTRASNKLIDLLKAAP